VEHGICPIAEFTSPWLNCAHSNRIPAEIWRFLILIFQDGGRRHLGFSKFQFFNGRNGQEGRTTSACQISSKSVERRPRYGYFQFLKMAAAATLDLWNFKFLTVILKNLKGQDKHGICPIAEFTSPWLNCAHSNIIPAEIWRFLILIFQKDMATFRFFKMASLLKTLKGDKMSPGRFS